MTRTHRALCSLLAVAFLWCLPGTATANYGSGTLGDWTTQTERNTGNPQTADVTLIGDSVAARCWPALQGRLKARGITLAVNAWPARPTGPAVDWVLQHRPTGIVVMETGLNDLFNPPVMTGHIRRLFADVHDPEHVMWVDTYAVRTRYPYQLADARNSAWVNAQIWANVPYTQVIPWSVRLAEKPGRITAYLVDGVHPSPGTATGTGCAYWAAVYEGPIVARLKLAGLYR